MSARKPPLSREICNGPAHIGEIWATQPTAPAPLNGVWRQTGPHSRLPDTEAVPVSRVPDPGGRSPQAMAALRQRGVFDVVRPHACAVAQQTDAVQVRGQYRQCTVCANPSAPWERTRSRPRCSRLLIADSTAGCWRLASANVCASSRPRSATESRPLRGSALRSSMASSCARCRAVESTVEAAHP